MGVDQRPEWIAEERSVADIVEVALRSVRDADRQLLELRYLAGWTNDELAAHLGIGSGTVRKRVHDARQRLRPHLEHLNPKEATMADLTSYLDLVHDAGVVIPDAPPLHAPDGAAPTPTGLKIIDTAAPVVRGGTIEMVGPAGAGQVVVALELLYRIGRTEAGTACVAIGAAGTAIGSQPDLGHIVTEPGIPGPNAALLTRDPKDASKALLAGSRLARGLAATGIDVVVVVDSPTLREVGAAAAVGLAGLSEGGGSVTVVAIWGPEPMEGEPVVAEFDTTLVFSVEQFALGIFPAIDPVNSRSRSGGSPHAESVRRALGQAAELRSWFHQPMFVAQDHTGEPGLWVEGEDADRSLEALLT